MRIPRVAAVAVAAGLTLAGCSNSGSGSESTSGATDAGTATKGDGGTSVEDAASGTVEWWLPNWDEPAADTILADFSKEHPEITVKKVITTWDTMANQIRVALESGAVPDVITELTSRIPLYARQGQLADVSTWYDDSMPGADFYTAAVQAVTVGEGVYAVPFRWDAGSMVYNKALFEEAGIQEAPSTWTELQADAKAIKEKTGAYAYGWPLGDTGNAAVRWENAYVTFGGKFIENADGSVSIDVGASQKAIENVTEGFQEGYVTPSSLEASNTDLQNLLTNGQLAFYFEGAYAVQPIKDAGIDVGTAMWPGPDGASMVSADGFSFMVPKAAKNIAAAKVLTQFLAGADNQALMTATFPARQSAAKEARFADPLLQPFLEQQGDHAFPAPAYVGWDQFIGTVQSVLQSVALGDRTAIDANADIVQQAGLVLRTK